ncbi:25691_t:CDS:1, partial [Gigaspora margarita]
LNKNYSNQALMDKNFCIIEIIKIKDEKYKTTNIDQAESIMFVTSKNISEDDMNNNNFFEIKKGIISSRNKTKSDDKDPDSESIIVYEDKKFTIDEFLKYLTKEIKFLLEEGHHLESYLSDECKYIYKDIFALQKDINYLENFYLREEFG